MVVLICPNIWLIKFGFQLGSKLSSDHHNRIYFAERRVNDKSSLVPWKNPSNRELLNNIKHINPGYTQCEQKDARIVHPLISENQKQNGKKAKKNQVDSAIH